MIRKPITPQAALDRAELLCSRGEYSRREIFDRCRRWGLSAENANTVADTLVDSGMIDDRRFAKAFTLDRVNSSRWGMRKIAAALALKGVARDIIAEALDLIDPEQYKAMAISLVAAKARQIDDPASRDGRQRILRFMLSRGFEPSIAINIINKPNLWLDSDV